MKTNMLFSIVLLVGNTFVHTDAITCGDNWIVIEKSKCVRFFDSFETIDQAADICASIPSEPQNTSKILSIKTYVEQEFITNWIFTELGVLNGVWLNGERHNGTTFIWRDGDHISFTNWDNGFPTNETSGCMEMSPWTGLPRDLMAKEDGKWKDVPCSKRNLVICEKKPELSNSELRDLVFHLRDNLVPLGFVYVQLPYHPAPQIIWPTLLWKNVTDDYAGLFFRAEGGTSSAFGVVQEQSVNRLLKVENKADPPYNDNTIPDIPDSGYSNYIYTGSKSKNTILDSNSKDIGLRFRNSGSETRPRNMAIRIWERV